MIVGAAIIPSAPLLVPGVSAVLPTGVDKVYDAVEAAVESLPPADTAVLVAVGSAAVDGDPGWGVYDTAEASLAGIGRPDIVLHGEVSRDAAARITSSVQYPMYRGDALPLGLAVLALLSAGGRALVPLAVHPTASFEALVAVGAGVARALADSDERAVVVAAGDLSAGLDERSPLYRIDGAADWDERVVSIVDSGRLDGLARMGPQEARRVGALGWAPMALLHGAMARAKLGLVVRHYSAPRGVGYLVAHGG